MHGPAIGWCRLRRARRVGKLIVQLSRHRGIRTINVVRRRAAVSEIYERGGTEVICTEDEDLAARVTDVVGVDGVRKPSTVSPVNLGLTFSERWHRRANSSCTARCPRTATSMRQR
jgi:hypothetical protein